MTDLMNEILDLHAIAGLDSPSIPLNAARMSLFDWMVCGRAGTREPVAEKMHAFMTAQAGAGAASVFGSGMAPPRMAALVNGTTIRALDFDHTHFAHVGQLSVGGRSCDPRWSCPWQWALQPWLSSNGNSGGIWGSHCCRALNEPNP